MLSNNHKRIFIFYYTACFTISYALLFFSGSLLHQTAPIFVINRLDLSLNILLLTGIADACYFLIPLLLWWAVVKRSAFQYSLAFLTVIYSTVYTLLITSLSAMSIQWFIASIFIPAIFVFRKELSFYFAFQCLRYLFIIFFFSAGLWKIRAGGLFNLEQMSAILLRQHGSLLVSAPENWYAIFILKIVSRPLLAYALYLMGTLAELSFIVGFFTKKWDRLLLLILLLFILFDLVLMKINYFPWVAFGFLFWNSSLKEPLAAETR